MQRRILSSDPTLMRPTPPTPAGTARRPKPAQLPPDLPDFVGHTDLQRSVTETLTRPGSAVPVVGLTGLAGVGKTALAVHIGHQVAAAFPDGQIFVDLGSEDTACPDPGSVLGGLLRTMGVPGDALPERLGERVTLWRTVTSGLRLLVVLDNARDGRQVLPLLPGSGCAAVVVTARRRLVDLVGARWTKVDALRENEALTLLGRVLGPERVQAEPAAARRLVIDSSGLPQAIRVLGSQLAARPGWSLAAAEQRKERRRPDTAQRLEVCAAIERPYESVYGRLSPEQARAFRFAAIPDGPDISLATAAAVLGLSPVETENLLEALADVHLVEPGAVNRYRYHTPVRYFARSRAIFHDGEAEIQAALGRLVRFYLASAHNALRAVDPAAPLPAPEPPAADGLTFPSAAEARSWVLLERDHMLAASAQASGVPGADRLALLARRDTRVVSA
jgi:hypothetical protein